MKKEIETTNKRAQHSIHGAAFKGQASLLRAENSLESYEPAATFGGVLSSFRTCITFRFVDSCEEFPPELWPTWATGMIMMPKERTRS